MKFPVYIGAMALGLFLTGAAEAQTLQCNDPPTTPAGQCNKDNGARCDPATRRWIGGSSKAIISCVTALGQTRTSVGKDGNTYTMQLTGRYSDCMRDSRKLGNTVQQAKTFCDSRGLR